MGIFGMKFDRKRLRAGDPADMRMAAPGYDDAGVMQASGLIQGGDTSMERLPGFYAGGDKFTGRDAIAMLLSAIGDGLSQNAGGRGGAVDNLGGMRMSAIKMAQQQAQQQALMEAAQRRGLNPDDVALAQGGLGGMLDGPELPERARMAQWYQNATPEERAAFDQTNPIVTQGFGSTVVPRSAFPGSGPQPGTVEDGFRFRGGDPADRGNWEQVGGGASNGTGGFRGPPRYRR